MRRLALLVGLVALLAPSAAIARSSAKVWIADRSPLIIRASGFKAHERVTVTVRMATKQVFHRVASRKGTFAVTLPAGNIKLGCNTMTVLAVGAAGTRAALKVPGVDCPPPPPADSA
jgi:hypothetical protein